MAIQSFKDALCYARRESNDVEKRRKEIAMTFEEYETIIYNQARAETAAETKAQDRVEFAQNMARNGFKISDIALALNTSQDEVHSLLEKPA